MHRTDGNGHVANMFDDGDPGVPTVGTQIEESWLNAVQEEIVGVVTDAGISLVKNTNTQLLAALRSLFVRTTGSAAQTITGNKYFNGLVSMVRAAGAGLANLTIENLDTSADSQALNVTSSSVGTTAKFRNSSTARAAQFQSEDARPTIRLVPLTTIPSTGLAEGDVCYVAGSLHMLYVWDGTAWNACW